MRVCTFRMLLCGSLVSIMGPNFALAGHQSTIEKGLRFDSLRVLDLADRSPSSGSGKVLTIGTLTAAEGAKIQAAKDIGADSPALRFSDDVFGCVVPSRDCSLREERKLIDAEHGIVKRNGKQLSIIPAGGAALVFLDWKMPTTKSADGDAETHWYVGRLAGSAYERVEVQFGQDAPGNFLVNSQNGKIAFVHNGADVVALSPDGMYLVTFNALNSPLDIRVAALDANGPRLALQCHANDSGDRFVPVFKGWRDARVFDLAVNIEHGGESAHPLALRVSRDDHGWNVAASDINLTKRIGLVCRQDVSP